MKSNERDKFILEYVQCMCIVHILHQSALAITTSPLKKNK